MRKYIISFFFVLLLIGGVQLLLLGYIDSYIIAYRPLRTKARALLNNKYKIIIGGDSRAQCSIDPSLFTQSAINIGTNGASIWGFYKALLLNNIDLNNKIIIFNVGILNMNDERINRTFIPMIDDFLHLGPLFLAKKWKNNFLTNLNATYNCIWFRCPFYNDRHQKISPSGFVPLQEFFINMSTVEKQQFINGYEPYFEFFNISGGIYRNLIEVVDKLQQAGAKVVVAFLPNSPFYMQFIKRYAKGSAIEDYIYNLHIDLEQFHNVFFLDYLLHNNKFINDKDFADMSHLNAQGAIKITKRIIADMHKLHILKGL